MFCFQGWALVQQLGFLLQAGGGSWFKLREQPLRLRGKVAHISNPQSILWREPRALGSLYSNLCYIFSHRVCFLSICLRFHCLQNCCTISACLSLCIYTCLFLNQLNDGILFCCKPVLASGLFSGVFVVMTLLPLLNHEYILFYVYFAFIMLLSAYHSPILHRCFIFFVRPAYLHPIAC